MTGGRREAPGDFTSEPAASFAYFRQETLPTLFRIRHPPLPRSGQITGILPSQNRSPLEQRFRSLAAGIKRFRSACRKGTDSFLFEAHKMSECFLPGWRHRKFADRT
jgi:hypothetical protein